MKDDRHKQIAVEFGILSRCENLEKDLLEIPGVTEVTFDLDGWLSNIHHVIFLTKYSIDPRREDYFQAKRNMRTAIIRTALAHDLTPSGDAIEDYGEHLYFVRQCGKSWPKSTITE